MTPKERLFNALNDRPIDRIPTFCSGCSQTVTVESMEAIGVYWPEAHRDPGKMAELSESTYDLTGLEIAGVPYCLTIEAEALGCARAYNIIHNGPVERIRDHVRVAIEEGADMVAPGCDFWLKTPTEHVKAFVDAVKEFGKSPYGR